MMETGSSPVGKWGTEQTMNLFSPASDKAAKKDALVIRGNDRRCRGMPITEAEQNRLIVENTDLVTPIAALYRGRKGIPFEDVVAEGMAGLVQAARMWTGAGPFAAYAPHKIRSAIVDFIDKWQEFVAFEDAGATDRDADDIFLEWDVWPHAAPYESWSGLAATPEELVGAYEELVQRKAAFSAAMLSLRKRDRAMVTARFLRSPHQTLEEIAREHRISYARTVFIIDRALRAMRLIVETIEKRKPEPSNVYPIAAMRAAV